MTENERKRFFRYSLRRYASLGPSSIREEIVKLKNKFANGGFMNEESFWELYLNIFKNLI